MQSINRSKSASITDPLTAQGQLATATELAEVQISARYNTFRETNNIDIGGGASSVANSEYTAATNTDANSFAAIFSERQINSRPGQGSIIRIDARFSAPQNGNDMSAGASSAGDGIFFGYRNLIFGVEQSRGGAVQVQELTFTTTAAGGETADVVINGTTYPITFTATTDVETAHQVAIQLNAAVANYNFTANSTQVVMRSVFATPSTGAFTFTATGGGDAVGTFAQIALGITPTLTFISQVNWDDPYPELDHTKHNHYTIAYDGDIKWYIDTVDGGRRLVHTLKHPNNHTSPLFGTETLRLVWFTQTYGSSIGAPVSVSGGNASGFIQGIKRITHEGVSRTSGKLLVGTTNVNIMTIRCREVFGEKVNLGRLEPLEVTASTSSTKGAVLDIFKNATLGGIPNFTYINKSDSISEIDTDGTTVTGGELIHSAIVTTAGIKEVLGVLMSQVLAGDTITFAMRVTANPTSDMNVGFSWEEDI